MSLAIQFKKFTGNNVDEQINHFLQLYSDCEINLIDIQYQQCPVAVNKKVKEEYSYGFELREKYVYKLVDEVEYSALVKYKINLELKEQKDNKILRQNELLRMGVVTTINYLNKYLRGELPEDKKWEGEFLYKNLKDIEFYDMLHKDYSFDEKLKRYVFTWTGE